MAQPLQSLGTEVITILDGFTNGYVGVYAQQITNGLAPIVTAAIVIYLFFRGWAIIRGDSQETFPALTREAFRIAFILAIGLGMAAYLDLVWGTLFALRDWLVGVMLRGQTIADLVNDTWAAAREFINANMTTAWFGLVRLNGAFFGAILTVVAMGLLLIFALGYYALCQVALTLLGAVGPVFVLCAMFPSTQRFTESWLSQVLNYVLLAGLAAAATVMSLLFGLHHIRNLLDTRETLNVVSSVVSFDIAILANLVLLLNLNNIATALTGGIGLQGASRMVAGAVMRVVSPPAYAARTAAGGQISRAAGPALGHAASAAEGIGNPRSAGYLYQQAARLGQQRN